MTLLEYVKKIPGHRNSKGEPAPWTIVSHKTGKVISSHKTKEEAEKHLQRMHYFKEDVNMNKVRKVCHDGECWYEVDVDPNVEESVVIDCIKCGDTYVFNGVNEDEVENRSRPIQDILSNMDPSYREMFISGICPKCWNKMFGEDEMEESHHHHGHVLKEDVEKKYELTDEKMEWYGYTFYRIRALKDFGDVKAGDLGGWIESEKNLSQEGKCWVGDRAQVCRNANVHGNAKVYGGAIIGGNAKVFGNAMVYQCAEVLEDAQVFGDAVVCDYSVVDGSAKVYGRAQIDGEVKVTGDARVHGRASVYGNAKVYGDADVYGDAVVCDYDEVCYAISKNPFKESCRPCGHMLKEDVEKKYIVTNEPPYERVKVLFTTDDYDEAVELIEKYAKERQGTFIVRDAKTGKILDTKWNEWTLWSITHDNS